jgi:hypothetical protein
VSDLSIGVLSWELWLSLIVATLGHLALHILLSLSSIVLLLSGDLLVLRVVHHFCIGNSGSVFGKECFSALLLND